jgi:hypothetical protein
MRIVEMNACRYIGTLVHIRQHFVKKGSRRTRQHKDRERNLLGMSKFSGSQRSTGSRSSQCVREGLPLSPVIRTEYDT